MTTGVLVVMIEVARFREVVMMGRRERGGIAPSFFGPKFAAYASPTTVGGSALALHYANVIIVIEKLLHHPHLVGESSG
ncbi:hypothetical protein V6N13_054600 [Hibiscus sabdariffa]